MLNKTAEINRLTAENAELQKENAALKARLDNLELEFYRALFTRVNINIEGGQIK